MPPTPKKTVAYNLMDPKKINQERNKPMIPRYSRKVMARIWTEENKFASWLKVELAAMRAMAECGLIPPEVPQRAARKAKIDVARILEIEAKTHHDVAAFVDQVAAGLGEDGRYFHFGLTSSDVLDTALGLRLTEAADLLAGRSG